MTKKRLDKLVAGLSAKKMGNPSVKNWRRTRGAFTGDLIMQQVFAEGRKIRAADDHPTQTTNCKKRPRRS
jgi:hypothetical protein